MTNNPSDEFSFDESSASSGSGTSGSINFDFSQAENAQPGVYTYNATFGPGQPPQVSQSFTPLTPGQPVNFGSMPPLTPEMQRLAQQRAQNMLGNMQRGRGLRLGCFWWGFILFMTIIFPIGLFLFINGTFSGAITGIADSLLGENNFISQISGALDSVVPDTQPIPANTTADAFDPVAALPGVRSFAGDGALLAEIYATSVRPDGTINLNATYTPAPYVDYQFYRPVPRPDDAPPIGAGGTSDGQWYEPIEISAYQPGRMSQISSTGGGVSVRTQFVNQGLARDADDPTTSVSFDTDDSLLDPACSFAELWRLALSQGAPQEAVATISYDSSGYDFAISGVLSLRFDRDCKLR